MSSLYEPIKVIEMFCATPINDSSIDIRDLGLDSISFIKLIVFIEDYYNIEFPEEMLSFVEAQSVKGLCGIIEKLRYPD